MTAGSRPVFREKNPIVPMNRAARMAVAIPLEGILFIVWPGRIKIAGYGQAARLA
jgi:hypothetical protein